MPFEAPKPDYAHRTAKPAAIARTVNTADRGIRFIVSPVLSENTHHRLTTPRLKTHSLHLSDGKYHRRVYDALEVLVTAKAYSMQSALNLQFVEVPVNQRHS